MRKFILVVLALLCLLTACSQPEQPQEEERDNVGQITYAGICFADGEEPLYRQELEKELLRLGYYVNFADAKGDQSVQNQQIEQFITEQYDVLIVEPVMTASADVILTRLQTAQIPVVLLGKQLDAGVLSLWERASYVGFDDTHANDIQEQIILNVPNAGDVNGDGQVAYAILAGPEENIQTGLYVENCTTTMARSGISLQELSIVYSDDTRENSKALTEGLLSQFGRDIEVLFCSSDDLALGALDALENSGRTVNQDIYVVGIGGNADVLSLVSQGVLTGTAMADYDTLGLQAAKTADLLLTGNAEQVYLVEYVLKETP